MTTKNNTSHASTAALKAVPAAAKPARAHEHDGRSTEERIRARAYEICQARNGGPGDACSDWLQAERELGFARDQAQPECCDPPVIETRARTIAPSHAHD